ncbi:MAG: SAM-dependent DNA methyltransferase [Myxococcales bacterium]|nr:SAM-dependent DNA methyltransferase [Myxococcales bacterium]
MTFIPKHAVLEALARPRLAELARALGITPARSRREMLVQLGMLPDHRFRDLLMLLQEPELRAIARAHHLADLRDGDALAEFVALGSDDEHEPPPRRKPTRDLRPTTPEAPPAAPPPPTPIPDTDDDLPANVTRLRRKKPAEPERRGGELGFEATLWQAADKLRSNMDAAEYKHVVLGLLFLKYISDAFERHRDQLHAAGQDSEDPGLYTSARVFWVPPAARWRAIAVRAESPGLGQLIDHAMAAIESDNPALAGVLPQIYQRPGLEGPLLGELVRLFGGLGHAEQRGRDVLGRVYEYFLTRFASAEGKNGGQFYTPRSVVRLLVAMLAPTGGSVYDPACGSGGMFVQSERFLVEHGGRHGDLRVFGQESNPTTWRLARMNLALRGIDGNLGPEHADSFHRDLHPDLRADYVLANPPFNTKDWGAARLQNDPRWRFGVPPAQNANFAWVSHIIHHLAPRGLAGFVLANGAMTTSSAGEGEIRRAIVEADLVDCMVALPAQLFYSTQIPVCLWLLARDKADPRLRDRRGQVLMIDARDLGSMADRTHRELLDHELTRLVDLFHAWRGDPSPVPGDRLRLAYTDVPGLARSVTLQEIAAQDHILAPGRYVAPAAPATPLRSFADELAEIDATLRTQLAEARTLDDQLVELLDHLRPPNP